MIGSAYKTLWATWSPMTLTSAKKHLVYIYRCKLCGVRLTTSARELVHVCEPKDDPTMYGLVEMLGHREARDEDFV